jgi:hypothetical protein
MARETTLERPSGSATAVVAGALVAFGSLATIMATAGAVGSRLGLQLDGISTDQWHRAGVGGAAIATVVLFGCFLFGGYTAGRMAAAKGDAHGLMVFLLSALVIGVIVVLAATWGDPGHVADQLRDNGVPTTANTWSDIGLGVAVAGLVAMVLGSVLGGRVGSHWHRAVADYERQRLTESSYRGNTEVIDVRDEHPEYEPSVEEEREQRRARDEWETSASPVEGSA